MMTAKVLRMLYDSLKEPVSGEKIGQALGVSRVSVQNMIKKLRVQGFDIESNTRTGHCLNSLTDVLNEEAVALFTDIPSRVVTEADSTFSLAKQQTAECLMIAVRQYGAKGRRKRVFSSNEGGAYFTYKCFPSIAANQANLLTLAAGIAVAKTAAHYGVIAQLKYPNDGWIDGKKFCGILTECTMSSDEILDAAIGIGINLYNNLPKELEETAVRLGDFSSQRILRSELIARVANTLKELIEFPCNIVEQYRQYDGLVGKRITLTSDGMRVDADYEGIDAEGNLLARMDGGEVRRVSVGEISIRA